MKSGIAVFLDIRKISKFKIDNTHMIIKFAPTAATGNGERPVPNAHVLMSNTWLPETSITLITMTEAVGVTKIATALAAHTSVNDSH